MFYKYHHSFLLDHFSFWEIYCLFNKVILIDNELKGKNDGVWVFTCGCAPKHIQV